MNLEQKKNFLINFAYWALIAILALLGIRYILPICLPFVFGFFFAYLIVSFSDRIGCKNRWLRLLLAVLLYAAIGGFISYITYKGVSVIRQAGTWFPALYNEHLVPLVDKIMLWGENLFAALDPSVVEFLKTISDSILSALTRLVSFLSKGIVDLISSAATGVPATLLGILAMIFSTFFVVMDAERIREFLQHNLPQKWKSAGYQVRDYLTGTLLVVLKSYLIIMLLTFTELTLLFWIFGIRHPAAKASLIAVLDILPLIGTGGILIPWAVISMIMGSFSMGVRLLVIYGIVAVIRNYLEPRIVGTQLGLHPIISLVAMFLGIRLFGFLGAFGLPIAISFFWKQYKARAAAKAEPEEA